MSRGYHIFCVGFDNARFAQSAYSHLLGKAFHKKYKRIFPVPATLECLQKVSV